MSSLQRIPFAFSTPYSIEKITYFSMPYLPFHFGNGSFFKHPLYRCLLEEWRTSWKNGDTGSKIYSIMPSVSLRPTNWIREDVIFFSQHGPFPAYLEGVTSLTAIIAAVLDLARHFTMPRSVSSQRLGI
ncbi:hypothetical protein AVEN_270360-1 [Araneus ventricosus]|uniref:Uncharacterized protein n=1 Tax=Araneus ventricosus TaxID=182803 RepID=A0A4Y2MIH1_ARAVE|nr:hypothetical protein AVEN_270360-1 [Araneus ventricosus]